MSRPASVTTCFLNIYQQPYVDYVDNSTFPVETLVDSFFAMSMFRAPLRLPPTFSPFRKVQQRVPGPIVDNNLKVQVGPGAPSCGAHQCDQIALADLLPSLHL